MTLTRKDLLAKIDDQIGILRGCSSAPNGYELSEIDGLEFARDLIEQLPPCEWKDEPDGAGWYWIANNTVDRPQYLQRWGGDGAWGFSEGVSFFLLNGRRVAACVRPGGE